MNTSHSEAPSSSDPIVREMEKVPDGSTEKAEKPCCCCGAGNQQEIRQKPPNTPAPWVLGTLDTPVGAVPQVTTRLQLTDHLGAWRVRWAINRMGYRVPPGLYAVGTPGPDSPVLVSANYKMSFDRLRSQLSGLDAWILVLDTQGVNVWCAAGKGTFGTDELVRRIGQYNVLGLTSHRTVIVPQLAAPGVAAHEVRKRTGVRVVYGPIRAEDLPAFLATGMKATSQMRRALFPFRDRVAMIPVELVTTAKWPVLLAGLILILAGLGRDGYAWSRVLEIGLPSAALVLLTSAASLVLGPALLPWLPGRAFSLKGFWIGTALLLTFIACGWFPTALGHDWASTLAWSFLLPAGASVLVMKFTGASMYTSLSGVRHEMRVALPLQLAFAILGLVLWLIGRFL